MSGAANGGRRQQPAQGRGLPLTLEAPPPDGPSLDAEWPNGESACFAEATRSTGVRNAIECLLLVRGGPVRLEELRKVLDVGEAELCATLAALQVEYEGRGLQVQEIADGYQLCTRPEYGSYVQRLLRLDELEPMTRATLEVLAIVAYRQPITRAEVDVTRGVQSTHHLLKLQDRRLIREVGRRPGPGRPILYSTTEGFLKYFGLKDLGALPKLGDHEVAGLLVPPGS